MNELYCEVVAPDSRTHPGNMSGFKMLHIPPNMPLWWVSMLAALLQTHLTDKSAAMGLASSKVFSFSLDVRLTTRQGVF